MPQTAIQATWKNKAMFSDYFISSKYYTKGTSVDPNLAHGFHMLVTNQFPTLRMAKETYTLLPEPPIFNRQSLIVVHTNDAILRLL